MIETGSWILAHLDVVPVGAAEWDNRNPRAIKELELKIKDNPRIFLGCNEESGSAELKYYFAKEEPAEMTISPDASFPWQSLKVSR